MIVQQLDTNIGDKGLGKIEIDRHIAAIFGARDNGGESLIHRWIDPDPSLRIDTDSRTIVYDGKQSDGLVRLVLEGSAGFTEVNGYPAFSPSDSGGGFHMLSESQGYDVILDTGSWGLTACVNPIFEDSYYSIFGIGVGSTGSDKLFANLRVQALSSIEGVYRFGVAKGGTTNFRSRTSATFETGKMVVVTVGFDIETGFSWMVNGRDVSRIESGTDTAPLTEKTLSFLSDRGGSPSFPGTAGISIVHPQNPLRSKSTMMAVHREFMEMYDM